MRSHLLNRTTAEDYRRSVTAGVEQVAARFASVERPFSGMDADGLGPVIDAIDLDRPLGDTAAALAGLALLGPFVHGAPDNAPTITTL